MLETADAPKALLYKRMWVPKNPQPSNLYGEDNTFLYVETKREEVHDNTEDSIFYVLKKPRRNIFQIVWSLRSDLLADSLYLDRVENYTL